MKGRKNLLILACLIGVTLVCPLGAHAANIVVTNANDSGPGSFREALGMAESNGATADTITFGPGLAGSTIVLQTPLPTLYQSNTTIDGTDSPTIDGSGILEGVGLRFQGGDYTAISNINVTRMHLIGFKTCIKIEGAASDIYMAENEVSASTYYTDFRSGISYHPRGGFTGTNISFVSNKLSDGGLCVGSVGATRVDGVYIRNNQLTGAEIQVNTYENYGTLNSIDISSNTFKNVLEGPGILVQTSYEGISTDGSTISNITITNNDLENTGGIVLHIETGVNNKITGALIEQNRVRGSSSEGINFGNNASTDNLIQGVIRNNIVLGSDHEAIGCSGPVEAEITNNLCGGNREGLGFSEGARVKAANNLFIQNGSGVLAEGGSSALLVNNLVVGNCACGIKAGTAAAVELSYNNVWGNEEDYCSISKGSSDISADPRFVNSGSGDFHLASDSPCIDAGNPAQSYNDAIPPGKGGLRNDIGVYGGPMAAEFDFLVPAVTAYTCSSEGWEEAYDYLFYDPSDLALLRLYRDKVLAGTARGKLYTDLLYRSSEEALEVLLAHPELMCRANELILANRGAVERVLRGDRAIVWNASEVAAFLDAFAEKAPPDLRLLIRTVENEMLDKKNRGEPLFGFELE